MNNKSSQIIEVTNFVDLPIAGTAAHVIYRVSATGKYYIYRSSAWQEIHVNSSGFLKADGTTPLTNNWNVGSFSITASSFIGALTGNASTATALQTARNINGVSFDGTANITVTAAAGTLTGTTLNSSVVSSSLTSVGTIGTGTWQGTAIADSYISSASTWNAKIGGSGTTNYLSKFTASGTIGNSQIRDDSSTLSIGTTPISTVKFFVSSTVDFAGWFRSTNSNSSYVQGLVGEVIGSTNGFSIGVEGRSLTPNSGGNNIGGWFRASSGTQNYSVQLQDGTEGTGKFLKSVQSDGRANWVNITESDISGFGTYAKVGTYTNNYITKWNATTNTLQSSQIQDDGTTITLGGETVINSNLVFAGTVNNSLTGANQRIPSHTKSNITFTNASLTSIASANNGGIIDGHVLFLTNATGNSIIIVNNYGSAAAGEAIFTGTGTDTTIPDKGSFWLRWNTTTNSWLCSSSGVFNIQDSQLASTFIKADGTVALTADWYAGASRRITAGYLTSTNDASIAGLTLGLGANSVSGNTVFGYQALNSNLTGGNNTIIGYQAGYTSSSVFSMTAIGFQAGKLSTVGLTAVGSLALASNTTGVDNVAFGLQSLTANTTGNSNTAYGYRSGYINTTGDGNAMFGKQSLYSNTTGSYNTAIGFSAGFSNTTGSKNMILGFDALLNNATGSSNVAIGYIAGVYLADGTTANTTPNQSIFIGENTKSSTNSDTNQIVIGHNTIGNGSNTTTIGAQGTTTNTYLAGYLHINNAYKLPNADGTANYYLKTDGSGNVSWAAITADALTTNPLSQFASTTSAQLAGVISDETGTGSLVFASAPTLTNPVVGTQSNGDNSTKAASTAYVANALSAAGISSLVPAYSFHETFRGVEYANNSTTETTYGGITMSTSGSTTARSVATTNFATRQVRKGFVASVVTTGKYTGTRGTALLWYVTGGFRFVADVYISDTAYASGCRQFYGMMGQTTDLTYSDTVLVDTMTNVIGFGSESTDTNINVFHNDATGTCTKVDLGSSFPANRSAGAALTAMYSFELYNDYSGNVYYKATNNETGAVVEGTLSTNLPASTQGLNFVASRCMGGGGGLTNSGQFDLGKLGVYSI